MLPLFFLELIRCRLGISSAPMPIFKPQFVIAINAEPKSAVSGSAIIAAEYRFLVWVGWQDFYPTSNGKCHAKIDVRRFHIGFCLIQIKSFMVDKATLHEGRAVPRAKVRKGTKLRINSVEDIIWNWKTILVFFILQSMFLFFLKVEIRHKSKR